MTQVLRIGRIALAGLLVMAMGGCVVAPWGYGHDRGGDRGHHDRGGERGGDRGGRDGR